MQASSFWFAACIGSFWLHSPVFSVDTVHAYRGLSRRIGRKQFSFRLAKYQPLEHSTACHVTAQLDKLRDGKECQHYSGIKLPARLKPKTDSQQVGSVRWT